MQWKLPRGISNNGAIFRNSLLKCASFTFLLIDVLLLHTWLCIISIETHKHTVCRKHFDILYILMLSVIIPFYRLPMGRILKVATCIKLRNDIFENSISMNSLLRYVIAGSVHPFIWELYMYVFESICTLPSGTRL